MKFVPLKEIATIDWGNTSLTKSAYVENGKYIAVSATGCDGKINHFEHDYGTLVLSAIGANCGKMFLPESPFTAIKNTITIKPKEVIHSKYLFRYLNNFQISSRGAGQPFITKSETEKKLIPLPPLPQQEKIAKILDAADALRQNDKALIAKYDELTQALFLDMFGDPVSNPKGWEKVKFSYVGKLDRGKSKHRPRNAPELLGGNYPLIQTGDIANSGGYITEYKSTYSEIGLAQSKLWKSGTLCITIAANIAKTGILTFDACFPDSVVGFIPNEKTNNEYTQYWLSFLQKLIEDAAPESAQKNINLAILNNLDFPLPPISLQNQFVERLLIIEEQKSITRKSLEKSNELFNSLLQKAFKGELE